MNDIEKLLEATRLTDEILVTRGYKEGSVDLAEYFFGDDINYLYAFTSKNKNAQGKSARDLMAEINRLQLLLQVQSIILENASNYAYSGVTNTNNIFMNLIIKKSAIDIQNNNNSYEEMQDLINKIIKNCKSSEDIINAISNNIEVLEISDNIDILKSEAVLLSSYAELIKPNKEEKVVFIPSSGPKR